jgi:hypothetical protein
MQRTADRRERHSPREQHLDVLEPLVAALRETTGRVKDRDWQRDCCHQRHRQLLEGVAPPTSAVLGSDGLHSVAQIRKQMPSISHLGCCGRTKARPFGVAPSPVAADDLWRRALTQPGGKLLSRPPI